MPSMEADTPRPSHRPRGWFCSFSRSGSLLRKEEGRDAYWTVSWTDMVLTRLPLVPVIVSVEAPAGAFFFVVTVSVDDDCAGFGENDALPTRPVSPATVSVTAPLKPPWRATVTV